METAHDSEEPCRLKHIEPEKGRRASTASKQDTENAPEIENLNLPPPTAVGDPSSAKVSGATTRNVVS